MPSTKLKFSPLAGLRGLFPNKTGTSCWLASLLQSCFNCPSLVVSALEHQRTQTCGAACWQCALRAIQEASRHPGSSIDLAALWAEPLQSVGVTFDEQQDPLEILNQLLPKGSEALSGLWAQHVHCLKREQTCACVVELATARAAPVRHFIASLRLPSFDPTASICLPDLLESDFQPVPDGGLPCPSCSADISLCCSDSWQLGPVALLQLVRETAVGGLNRIAVFAPPEFENAGHVFHLRAAVLHRGDSFDSGHYIAFVVQADGIWVQYNDGTKPKRLCREPKHLQTHARYFTKCGLRPAAATLCGRVGQAIRFAFSCSQNHAKPWCCLIARHHPLPLRRLS